MVQPVAKLARWRDATRPQSSDVTNPDASTSTEGTVSTELASSSAPTSSAVPTTTTSTIPTPPVWDVVQPGPSNSGAFLGLSTGLSRSERAPRLRSIEEASGQTYDIGHVFHAWDMAIPTSDDLMHIEDNRLLMISSNGTDTIEIAAGDHDDWIRTQARATRDLGIRVLFRWLWEMDGRRRIEVAHSGPDYVAAWNHVRTIFTEEGATNAEFVWCPNEFLFLDDGDPEPWYPGDENVDWLCADGYNWGTTEDGDDWTDLVDIFGDFYAWAEPKGKPIVIGETGSGEAEPGAKAAWFRQIPETLPRRTSRGRCSRVIRQGLPRFWFHRLASRYERRCIRGVVGDRRGFHGSTHARHDTDRRTMTQMNARTSTTTQLGRPRPT